MPYYFPICAAPISIFGVTDGSTYTSFIKPKWYNPLVQATLARNSESPLEFTSGAKISDDGRYELIVYDNDTFRTINFTIDSNAHAAEILTNTFLDGPEIMVHFEPGTYYKRFLKSDGVPMIAIWAEDLNGNYLQTLYISAAPATNIMRYTDNWKARPQALPNWMHKAGHKMDYHGDLIYLADPEKLIPSDIDAVSGATQKDGFIVSTRIKQTQTYPKIIKIFFEINQSFDEGWYFFGDNNHHEEEGAVPFNNDKYYRGTGVGEPAIVYTAEIDITKPDSYYFGRVENSDSLKPVGYSHFAGRTGRLYKDFFAADGKRQRYKFDHAHKMVKKLYVEVLSTE